MKLKRIVSVLLAGIILMTNIAWTTSSAAINNNSLVMPARKQANNGQSSKSVKWPSGPKPKSLSCDSAIVMEVSTGSILYKKNIHKQHYPASITKILTALLLLENSSLSDTVTFSEEAVFGIEPGSSTIYSDVGEKMSMEQCLYAIMLESANEVCLAGGEHVAGSVKSFVGMMNDKVAELGLKNTHFNNPNGLPDTKHYTTAYDMAVISRQAVQNTSFRKIAGTRTYTCDKTNTHKTKRIWRNHHQMLNGYDHPEYEYKYCIGGKTGFTQASQYTLVTFAEKNGMQLLSVIMKAGGPFSEPNEYTDTTALLNFGFENYRKYNINEEKTEVNGGLFNNYNNFFNTESSPVYLSNESAVVLPKGVKLSSAKQKITYNKNANIKDGKNIIGKVTYTYDGRVMGSTDIIYEKASYNHLDEASRKIIDIEIEDIENNAAKNASKNKRIAKIKNAIASVFSPIISFIREHMFIPAIIIGAVLVILLIVFLFKSLRNRRGRARRSSGGYRSRAGRRMHARMQRRARRRNTPEKARRRNHSSHYQKRTVPLKSTQNTHKRKPGVSKRKRNTRESFGKNFFDF
ncbi:MAG: D-alanyl-D-alanine carboxypeptidase [Lachnospiraceae bacterium]|nr:D-alanyl-D-alanine carboxypeptidase [Lachnospiraceae bacterium]